MSIVSTGPVCMENVLIIMWHVLEVITDKDKPKPFWMEMRMEKMEKATCDDQPKAPCISSGNKRQTAEMIYPHTQQHSRPTHVSNLNDSRLVLASARYHVPCLLLMLVVMWPWMCSLQQAFVSQSVVFLNGCQRQLQLWSWQNQLLRARTCWWITFLRPQ